MTSATRTPHEPNSRQRNEREAAQHRAAHCFDAMFWPGRSDGEAHGKAAAAHIGALRRRLRKERVLARAGHESYDIERHRWLAQMVKQAMKDCVGQSRTRGAGKGVNGSFAHEKARHL
ncbi:MAG: hypothetical protein AAGF45_04695 [Pseudomonadota bacterium]